MNNNIKKILVFFMYLVIQSNALANYFLSIVLKKLGKNKEGQNRLLSARKHLSTSEYWQERFRVLNLLIT